MTRIGILGGGQLGRMLALAGYPLGMKFTFLDPSATAPVRGLGEFLCAGYDDVAGLTRLADSCDVATYEFESVPVESVRRLAARVPVHPGAEALAVAQERLSEKRLFERLSIPTVPFAPVDSRADFDDALTRIGLPAVLKTRRFGYDGRGQAVLRSPADADGAWISLGGAPLILEGFIPFDRELSLIGVRDRSGSVRCYPLVENRHHEGILRLTLAPAAGAEALQARAEAHFRAIAETLDYVGVLAIEWFDHAGRLLANEIAPRVHNSGHWTIEGAATSQFENHLRAVAGLPCGPCDALGHSAMVNFIGSLPALEAILRVEGATAHSYGKAERPGRKVGHATVVGADTKVRDARLAELAELVPGLRELIAR